MEFFADRALLRLRSRTQGNYYLHAEEDGVRITLRRRRGTLHEAWAVHLLQRGGASYVLLHGAAYGRYLGVVRREAPSAPAPALPAPSAPAPAHQGGEGRRHTWRAAQRVYDSPGQDDVLWEVLTADDGSDDVVIRHRTFGTWPDNDEPRTMMQWIVEAIPPREEPPQLPPVAVALPPAVVPVGGPIRRQRQPEPVLRRTIHFVWADHQGDFSSRVWRMLWFDGRSVSILRRVLADDLGVGEANALDITLCVRAGFYGRLTPLVIDLPSDQQAMDIVVLTTGSPAAQALVHPDVGAP